MEKTTQTIKKFKYKCLKDEEIDYSNYNTELIGRENLMKLIIRGLSKTSKKHQCEIKIRDFLDIIARFNRESSILLEEIKNLSRRNSGEKKRRSKS